MWPLASTGCRNEGVVSRRRELAKLPEFSAEAMSCSKGIRDLGAKNCAGTCKPGNQLTDPSSERHVHVVGSENYLGPLGQELPRGVQEGALRSEANHLRQTNEKLTQEIAQLQIDRCADVEELVYLRWVNACLRYELRNQQPSPGKSVARDLSKTLSPISEQKAKQLILEYANSGINEKSINLMDFDSEYCSSSQSSALTEYGKVDDSLADVTATKNSSSNKTKFLRKLKRLVWGKCIHHNKTSMDRSPTSCGTLERRASVSVCSFDDMMDRSSYDSVASCITSDNTLGNQLLPVEGKVREQQQNEAPWTRNLSRVYLDF